MAQSDKERRQGDQSASVRKIGVFNRYNSNKDNSPLKEPGETDSAGNFLSKVLEIGAQKKRKIGSTNGHVGFARNSIKSKLARLRAPNNASNRSLEASSSERKSSKQPKSSESVAKSFLVDIKKAFNKTDFRQFRKELKMLNMLKAEVRSQGKSEERIVKAKKLLTSIFEIFAKYKSQAKELTGKFLIFTPNFLRETFTSLSKSYGYCAS